MTITAGNLIAAVTGGLFVSSTGVTPVPTDSLLISPADILYGYLVATASLLTDPALSEDWPLYTAFMPEDFPSKCPTNAVSVIDTPGFKDARLMGGAVITKHGVQLTFRSKTHSIGWAKADEIAVAIDAVYKGVVTNGSETYTIINISRQGSINALGKDEKRVNKFTINLLLTIVNDS